MLVFHAVMVDEDDVAGHNCPKVLLAASEAILLNMVREHVKEYNWVEQMRVNRAEIDTMTVDEMNEKLEEYNADDENMGLGLFIYTGQQEV